jgi:hypothetical protein
MKNPRATILMLTMFILFVARNVLAIELGDPLPEKAREAGYDMMIASSQFSVAYIVEDGGHRYTITVDSSRMINYISPDDKSFVTPEGVKAGDTYERVRKLSTRPLRTEEGWAYFIELPSGWNAAFIQGKTMTEGKLSPKARVKWLFKRK